MHTLRAHLIEMILPPFQPSMFLWSARGFCSYHSTSFFFLFSNDILSIFCRSTTLICFYLTIFFIQQFFCIGLLFKSFKTFTFLIDISSSVDNGCYNSLIWMVQLLSILLDLPRPKIAPFISCRLQCVHIKYYNLYIGIKKIMNLSNYHCFIKNTRVLLH